MASFQEGALGGTNLEPACVFALRMSLHSGFKTSFLEASLCLMTLTTATQPNATTAAINPFSTFIQDPHALIVSHQTSFPARRRTDFTSPEQSSQRRDIHAAAATFPQLRRFLHHILLSPLVLSNLRSVCFTSWCEGGSLMDFHFLKGKHA